MLSDSISNLPSDVQEDNLLKQTEKKKNYVSEDTIQDEDQNQKIAKHKLRKMKDLFFDLYYN